MIDENKLIEELEELIEYASFDIYREEPKINISFEQLEDIIAKQPKVGEWIPCSERLPEEDGEYLVWHECGDGEDSEKGFMLVPFWTDIEMFGVYQDIFDSHSLGFVDSEFIECETAVAWMPLPEAYKGE